MNIKLRDLLKVLSNDVVFTILNTVDIATVYVTTRVLSELLYIDSEAIFDCPIDTILVEDNVLEIYICPQE